MGLTKTDTYSTEIIELSGIIKALGHPARMAIVSYLANTPNCITNDIVEELPLSQATVSQHLKELRNVDLIKGDIEGTSVCYCLNTEKLNKVISYFSEIMKVSDKFKCC
jgi:ArsR family transcriptional regulator